MSSLGKRRKLSGPQSHELMLTLNHLKTLRASPSFEEDPEEEDSRSVQVDDNLEVKLREMITLLESLRNDPMSSSSSAVNEEVLARPRITHAGWLYPKGDEELKLAIDATREKGATIMWSDDNMYKHLDFLLNTSVRTSEAQARLIIDTLFFRAACMMPSDKKVVMELEKRIAPNRPLASRLDTVFGVIDYTILLTSPDKHRNFLRGVPIEQFRQDAKGFGAWEVINEGASPFGAHIAQAVAKLVACATHLGHRHIRGAVTSGLCWVFIVVDMNEQGEGATYWQSNPVRVRYADHKYPASISRTSDVWDPAFITAILSTWMPESSVKFEDDGDQWFYKESR